MMVSRTTKHRRFETGGGGGRGGEGRGGVGQVGRVVPRDLKGMASSCISHTSLCIIWHLYGEWVGTVYFSLACIWGGGVDLAWQRSFCCAVPVHRDVLQFHEV